MTIRNNQSPLSWRRPKERERERELVVCQSARPREKADHLESVSWKRIRGSGDLFVSISRPLSRGRRGNSDEGVGGGGRRWRERAKSGGWHDAAGVPRARGKCTVVDVNPPTRRPRPARGPRQAPPRGLCAGPGEPSPPTVAPPTEISRYPLIGRFDGLSPPSRATGMIEWWKNSTGKARSIRWQPSAGEDQWAIGNKEVPPTCRLESDFSHCASFHGSFFGWRWQREDDEGGNDVFSLFFFFFSPRRTRGGSRLKYFWDDEMEIIIRED